MAREATKTPKDALRSHASDRDTILFTETVLHGRIRFGQGEVVKFEDPRAAAYFDVAYNGAEFTTKKATRSIGNDEINFNGSTDDGSETIDPATVIGNGREGIAAGTTVEQVAGGKPMASNGDRPLAARDAGSSVEA